MASSGCNHLSRVKKIYGSSLIQVVTIFVGSQPGWWRTRVPSVQWDSPYLIHWTPFPNDNFWVSTILRLFVLKKWQVFGGRPRRCPLGRFYLVCRMVFVTKRGGRLRLWSEGRVLFEPPGNPAVKTCGSSWTSLCKPYLLDRGSCNFFDKIGSNCGVDNKHFVPGKWV